MRTAFYVRVSTERQQQAQTIEQQVALLRAYVAERRGWVIEEQHIFRDDGHTGAKLQRPGLGVGGMSARGQIGRFRHRSLRTSSSRLNEDDCLPIILISRQASGVSVSPVGPQRAKRVKGSPQAG